MIRYKLFKSGINNTGHSVKFETISNYKKAAKVFSERDKNLEKVLLTCFNNGIATVGCCRGHKKDNYKPYISFRLDDFNNYLCYMLYLFKEERISFCFSIGRDDNYQMILNNVFNIPNFFSNMNNGLKKYDSKTDYLKLLPFDLSSLIKLITFLKDNKNFAGKYGNSLQFLYLKTYNDKYCYSVCSDSDILSNLFIENGFIPTMDGNVMLIDQDKKRISNIFESILADINLMKNENIKR